MLIALAVVGVVLALAGHSLVPQDPVNFSLALFGLWLLGGGLGLIIAMLGEIADESRNILSIVMMPLYFISGVILPIMTIPAQYRPLFLLNPIVHGIEAARSGFAPFYHAPPEISLSYLYTWVLVLFAVGLLLYRRFSKLIVAQ